MAAVDFYLGAGKIECTTGFTSSKG